MAVKLLVETEEKGVAAALEKMTVAMQKLREENKKLTDETKESARAAKEAHEGVHGKILDQVKDLGKMAAGYVTVEKGIEFVVDAYKEWKAQIREAGAEHAQMIDGVVADLARAGAMKDAQKIIEGLKEIPGVQEARGGQAFAGVSGSAPQMKRNRQIAIARSAAQSARFGEAYDVRQLGALAGGVGELFPGMEPGDVADIAAYEQSRLGDEAGVLTSSHDRNALNALVKAGLKPEEALALMNRAQSQGIDSRHVHSLADVLTKKFQRHLRGVHPLNDQQKAENEAAKTNDKPMERYPAIMNGTPNFSQEITGTADFTRLGGTDAIETEAANIRAAAKEDFLQQQLDAVPSMHRALTQAKATVEKSKESLVERGNIGELFDDFTDVHLREMNPGKGFNAAMGQAIGKGLGGLERLFFRTPEQIAGGYNEDPNSMPGARWHYFKATGKYDNSIQNRDQAEQRLAADEEERRARQRDPGNGSERPERGRAEEAERRRLEERRTRAAEDNVKATKDLHAAMDRAEGRQPQRWVSVNTHVEQ